MLLPITALYAGILFIILLLLGYRVGTMRGRLGISINYGDNLDLATAVLAGGSQHSRILND